jgi:hypothetical protein
LNGSDESLIDLLSLTAQQARSIQEGAIKSNQSTPWGEDEEEKEPYRDQSSFTSDAVKTKESYSKMNPATQSEVTTNRSVKE